MSQSIEKDLEGANIEISRIMITMFQGVYSIGVLIVAAYLLLVRNDAAELARVAGMCGVSLLFAVALGHHTSERISAWKRYIESGGKVPWETFKSRLKFRPMVPILDVGMAAAPLYVAWKLGAILWDADPQFAAVTLVLLLVALVLNYVGYKYAGK